ncbi:MAG: hypothetical protein QM756_36115 [Polyangiaceae bacterium]
MQHEGKRKSKNYRKTCGDQRHQHERHTEADALDQRATWWNGCARRVTARGACTCIVSVARIRDVRSALALIAHVLIIVRMCGEACA